MSGGELNYPAEVPGMVGDMQKTVVQVNQEMDTLGKNVQMVSGSSNSQAVSSFDRVHQQWQQLMAEHNRVLGDIAAKTGQGYDDMLAFDRQMASRMSGH